MTEPRNGTEQSEEAFTTEQHARGDPGQDHATKPFPVVGIGASAGGFEAFRQFLSHLPEKSGMAYLLVQHLDPTHPSRLSELLGRSTKIPVQEASHGDVVQKDHIYVIPPNTSMALAEGKLLLSPRGTAPGPHLPVDYLFRSLAADQQASAIAIVLSGTGSDGTLGMCEVKAVGGITFAQEEKTAVHPGMPHSAILSGCVDFVLSCEEIARRLSTLAGHPYLAPVPLEKSAKAKAEDQFNKILGAVRAASGVDFSLYRDSTIRRRILRRMALRSLRDWAAYASQLLSDRAEVDALYHDLLINVTSFFRDPEMFEALKTSVLPAIAASKAPHVPVRVWVPGCSTGQEAYSLAMAMIEFYDDKPARPPMQVFATDLSDKRALERARAGIYPESIEAELTPERLHRFFSRVDHGYRIDKNIRDMCVFARHNVTADPPFSHLDLISCRNVLIYLSTPLQKRVLPTFHYSLNVPGYLLLGHAETVGDNADLFELTDPHNRIYAKKASAKRPQVYFSTDMRDGFDTTAAPRYRSMGPAPVDFLREADRVLLNRYAPPGVLVNENLDILQYRGRTSRYLEAPPGEPVINVLKMAREGLFLELRSALHEAKKTGAPLRRDGLRVRADGEIREFAIEVIPVRAQGVTDGCMLILFHDAEDGKAASVLPATVAPPADPAGIEQEMVQLRQDLSATREYLQSMLEQQDAANEELRSANEEILSSNEELQSTNEELETAKEELQSANEELTTVNEQLHHRNLELTQTNNDLGNLMSSTNIPVVMVDSDLRIRRFTSPAQKALNLLPSDIGRPIIDIQPAMLVPDLEKVIHAVIESVQPSERTVRDRHGRWQSLRIYPYRTSDNRIEGAVITLVDIDDQKRGEEALRTADRRKDEFLATLAHELRNPLAPITNALEIMRRHGADDPQLRELLFRQVQNISRIVEDLIDVSRIVERKIDLRLDRVPLAGVIESAVEVSRPVIDSRRHRLTVELPREPVFLTADKLRLVQVFSNLLNNAAKFTEIGGRISLRCELRAPGRAGALATAPADGPHVDITIRDNGIGVPPDARPYVFDMFAQGDRRLDQTTRGLGVGLSLARALLQMHGGSIELMPPDGEPGTEFLVRLPVSDASKPAPANRTGHARRVLVVDDNRDQVSSLATLLKSLGHKVEVAIDGNSALMSAARNIPDVALIDLGLPDMEGFDVARRLRADPSLRSMVLVAVTGRGQEKDRERSRAAGFNHHLLKPASIDRLQEIIATAPAGQAAPGPDKPGGSTRKRKK